ncbi:MAG: thioredoxin domain-containing protein [Alphaproteobacteria bacterium]|nr:thioredoxin domain-containing protein [Alphaproteobacteria bacterium]
MGWLCLAGFSGFLPSWAQTPAARPELARGDISLGSEEAPVEILVYGSISCAECRRFHSEVLPKLKARYILSGEARFTLRTYPTEPVPVALAGAALSRCAGRDRFYSVINDMFASQDVLLEAARSGAAARKMIAIAARHGLSPEAAEACLSDPEVEQELQQENRRAPEIDFTPAVFINGRRVDGATFPAIETAMTAILNGRSPPPPVTPTEAEPPATTAPLALRPRYAREP